jgi:hypothetical protein
MAIFHLQSAAALSTLYAHSSNDENNAVT